MSDITLRVKAEFEQAQKAFSDLANSSDEIKKKIEKFSDSFKTENINKFIDRQKLLEVSLKGTRGETVSMAVASNNYQREIERLIKSGLSPESEAIQRLATEQENLKNKIKEATDVQDMQNKMAQAAETATKVCYAAIGAGIAAIGIATQKTAELGDQYAKTARVVGMTAETFQELDYVAKMSGIDNLDNHLKKLNKSMVDVSNDTGQLTKYLKDNDTQLLTQLQNVNSNEEAFMLLMDAINQAPDSFSKAEIATAAFGKAGQDLLLIANEGTDGIQNLRNQIRDYGVISNDTCNNSEKFLDAQENLKRSLQGVGTELTQGLMPGLTDTISKVADFIAGIDNWSGILTTAGYALAGITAGLTAFMVISKGAAVIQTLATAFKALTGAMAANPIGAIAVVVTAVLIPALIALYKNWDTVQTYLQQGIARLEYAFKWFGSVIKEKMIVAFAGIKAAGATLIDFIYGNIIRGVGKMLEIMGKLPIVGDMFQTASNAVNRLGNAMGTIASNARGAVTETIASAKAEQDATEAALKAKLESIDATAEARRAELEAKKEQVQTEKDLNTESARQELEIMRQVQAEEQALLAESEQAKNEIVLASLQERLAAIVLTENQMQNQQANTVTQFMEQRAQLETDDLEKKLAFLEEQKELLLSNDTLLAEERVAIEKGCNEAIKQAQNDLTTYQQQQLEMKLNSMSGFLNSIGQLFDAFGEKNEAMAIAAKGIAFVEAGINSALAFTKVLAEEPGPAWAKVAAAASVLTAGLAQQIKIGQSMISAETGGRFIVPNSTGVDSQIMRVNPGEEINVTPRGMADGQGESFNFNFHFEGSQFASIINKLAKRGELYQLQLAGNL